MEKKGNDINDDAKQMIEDGLAWLRLEHEVKAAAATRQTILRRQQWLRWGSMTLLVLAILCFGYIRYEKTASDTPQPVNETRPIPTQEVPQPTDRPTNTMPMPSNKPSDKTTPVASNLQQQAPRYDAPILRGSTTTTDPFRKGLLDSIWHTDYPVQNMKLGADFNNADQLLRNREFEEAYVNLQKLERKMPDNDTLRLLKGYCLLEMGEGSAALEYLQPLSSGHQDWQAMLDWHQSLAWLLVGSDDKAMAQLKRISTVNKHPYHSRSQRALQLLRKRK